MPQTGPSQEQDPKPLDSQRDDEDKKQTITKVYNNRPSRL